MRLSHTRHRRREQHRRLQTRPRILAEYIRYGSDGSTLAFLPTTARTTDLWLPDASGVYQQYGNGEVGIVDGNAVWCQPAATNILEHSQQVDSALSGWTTEFGTITQDATTIGGINVARHVRASIVENQVVGGQSVVFGISGATAGRQYTVSFWIKNNGGDTNLKMTLDEIGGAQANATHREAITISSTAERMDVTFTITENDRTSIRIFAFQGGVGGGSYDFYAGLYQIEEGAFATSYIPTAGSAVTINATQPVVSWPSGMGSGTMISLTFTPTASRIGYSGDGLIFCAWPASGETDRINLSHRHTDDKLRVQVATASSTVVDSGATLSALTANQEYTCKVVMLDNDFRLFLNGTKIHTDTNCTMPSNLAEFNVGWAGKEVFGAFAVTAFLGKEKDLRFTRIPAGITDAEVLALP